MEFIALRVSPFPKNQIPNQLKEHNIRINRYAQAFLAHPAFSTEHTRDMTIAIASLREIGLENGATLDEIFRQIQEYGLKPCPVNAGLFLRLAWRDQPKSQNVTLTGAGCSPDRAVVVLSEMIENDDNFPKGLYLRNVEGRLWLRGYICDGEYRFSGNDLFAFEKPDEFQILKR